MEPTLPHAPRSQVIAAQPPRRLPDGSVLLRVHNHAGAIEILFPPGLWPEAAPVAGPKPVAPRLAPPPGENLDLDRAVAQAIAQGGFSTGWTGAHEMKAFCVEHGLDLAVFRVALHRERMHRINQKRSAARRAARAKGRS